MSVEVTLVPAEDEDSVAADIERHLLAALARSNTQSRNEPFVLSVTLPDGDMVAGLTAVTSYGWLLIKTLWVKDSLRGKGFGRQLVTAAETRGLEFGCSNAWLDTSNPAAHAFYLKLGYSDFGVLENDADTFPPEHRRWFMKKRLRSEPLP
ncbi:GNAT family N-acetyltransferase [Roseibium sp.]|uniref:GNAT family N-acetyltransferase n=1 Tax=Roseibium sp. TaxID=1936156 RepID=UPI003BAEBD4A